MIGQSEAQKLKCTNIFDSKSNSLDCLNDSCSVDVHLHGVFLCNNALSGSSTDDRSGKKSTIIVY